MSVVQSNALTRRLEDVSELGRLRLALESAGEVVYDSLVSRDEIVWADNAEEIFRENGLSPFSTRTGLLSLMFPEGAKALADALEYSIENNIPYTVEYRMRLPSGGACWIEDRGSCVRDEYGNLARVIGVIRFVTDRREKESRLSHLAAYDELTGLYNRSRLRAHLDRVLERCWNDGLSGGFLVAAIDNLSVLNESFGFEVADDVIIEVGKRIDDHLGSRDILGRIAGNKFGVILGGYSSERVVEKVEDLKSAVRDSVIYTKTGPVSVSISVGYIMLPFHARSSQQALAYGEEALSRAKSLGRDRSMVFVLEEKRESVRRAKMRVADQIMSAMNDGRLSVFYQPIVTPSTGKPVFHECLLRISDHEGNPVPAGEFISVAEELGLIRLLDIHVTRMTLEGLRKYPDITVSMNVSGLTAVDPAWSSRVVDLISENKDLASRLIVEITETVALDDINEVSRFISDLKALGCRVAIDDFGAGYTSFRNLKTLDVDLVKIDGAFVKGLLEDTDNQFFVSALAGLARNFDLEIVAEWVETKDEVDMLESMGIDYLQGFYFGAAQPSPQGLTDDQKQVG